MRRVIIVFGLSLFLFASYVFVTPQAAKAAVASGCDASLAFLGLPTWYKYLDIGPQADDDCAVIGPTKPAGCTINVDEGCRLDNQAAIGRVALAIVEILLRLAVFVAVGFVIIGGFRYITSQGEPDNAKTARQTITNALIGLVISLISVAIVAFVANRISS